MTDMKKCRKCEQEFPAMKEYFRTRKNFKDGLSARCKSCEKEDEQRYQYAQPDPNMVKKCSNCHTSYPATTEFFYPLKTGRYGLTAKCRTCTLEINRQRNIPLNTDPNILKRCSKCGSEYPATSDYFSPDKQGTYGVTGQCKTCRRENTQKWRDENPGKVQEYSKNYYWTHREEQLAKNRDWHRNNKERRRKSHRDWYEKNADHARKKRRDWYQDNTDAAREYDQKRYEAKADEIRLHSRQWKAANPDKVQLQEQKRAARERGLPDTLTRLEWREAVKHWHGRCAYCGELFDRELRKQTLDHYIPLVSPNCPGTTAVNCVPACLTCNTSKGPKNASEWLQQKFGEAHAVLVIKTIESYFESLSSE